MKRKSSLLAFLLALGLSADLCTDAQSDYVRSSAPGRMTPTGATHYEKLCSGCHGSDGLALTGEAPPLAGSSWVSGPDARLIRIVVHGVKGPIQVAGKV